MELTIIQKLSAYALPVIFAITVHEAAHGYAAKYFGDMTAHYLGRITLNPLKHIDPMGTVLLPAVLFMMSSPFLFGWAKPVPVNFSNLRSPKKKYVMGCSSRTRIKSFNGNFLDNYISAY